MNASLRNCPECGRVFGYMGRNLCPDCLDKEEKDFKEVRKYVRDHPGAGVFEVAEGTGIEEETIMQFLRDGRLQSRGFQGTLECERCGNKISGGRYCEFCKGQMDASIRQVSPSRTKTQEVKPAPTVQKQGHKMYTKD
ncbi:MAG: MerR family transcriptional regulator [Firmicutes bacterium HGW-Firmicutes-15]|nr:MAG: MerR family transcriptional regulator [Firmicutes bacterium HGW-Firmicutes-15]